MNVADRRDRGCLDMDTLLQRIKDFENDMDHFLLAQAYWESHGESYKIQDDQLWIDTVWRHEYDLRLKKNRWAPPKVKKTPRFPTEDNLYEIWVNLEQNRKRYSYRS